MKIVNINIHAEGEYTGHTYDENILITKESYNKLEDEISKMKSRWRIFRNFSRY